MAKPIMVSDEAYRALKAAKREDESFSDVILRKFPKGDPARILAAVNELRPNPELSRSIREASKEMRKTFKMKEFDF
jgi:predicted CopG family antitoxin